MKLVGQTIIRFLMIDKGFTHKLNQLPIVNSLRGWMQLASGPAMATVLMTTISLAANVLIFRVVPPVQAGQFALLLAISQILSLLASLGQSTVIRRHYGRQPLGHYDWAFDLKRSLLIISPLALVFSGLTAYFYKFEIGHALVMFCVSIGLAVIIMCSQILASQQHYVSSNVILRLPNTLLLLIGLCILLLPEAERFAYLIVGYVSLIVITVVTAIWLVNRQVTRGLAHILWEERKQGIAFVISNLSYQWPEEGLLSLAGLFISTGQIAAVSALSLFLRPFGTGYDILNHILLTELARREQIRYKQMWWALFALTVTMLIGAIVLVPFTSSWLYAGQYDSFHYLIPLLVGGAALQLIEVLPRSHVIARSSNQVVNRFIMFGTANIVLGTVATLAFILNWEAAGLVLGIFLINSIRVIISISFSRALLTKSALAAPDLNAPASQPIETMRGD